MPLDLQVGVCEEGGDQARLGAVGLQPSNEPNHMDISINFLVLTRLH